MRNLLYIFNFKNLIKKPGLYVPLPKGCIVACVLFYITQKLILHAAIIATPGVAVPLIDYNFKLVKEKSDFPGDPRAAGKKIVLFMGASEATAACIPDIFDVEAGSDIYSYNLSTPAMTIDGGYCLLRKYLHSHPAPDYIVIRDQATEGRDDHFGKTENWAQNAAIGVNMYDVAERAFIAKNTGILLNYLLPSRVYMKFTTMPIQMFGSDIRHVWHYAVSYYKKHGKWPHAREISQKLKESYEPIVSIKKRNDDRINFWRSNRGWNEFYQEEVEEPSEEDALVKAMYEQELQQDEAEEERAQLLDPLPRIHNPYAYKLFDLAERRNIKVMLISNPHSLAEGKSRFIALRGLDAKVKIFWKSLQKKYDNIYFAGKGYRRKYYERDCFSDKRGVHLNRKGAEMYTKTIALEFKSLFGNF